MSPPTDFDARAKTWDEDTAKWVRAQRIAEAIAAGVPSPSTRSVLEYGAGTGLLGLALLPLVREVTLADSSEAMLEVAREKIATRGLTNARAVRLDLAGGATTDLRFDLVCTLMTLHHVPDTDGILRAFRGVLRAGGVLCISDLDAEDGSFHGAGFDGHDGFDRADLGRRMERAGFRDVRFQTVHEVERPTPAAVRRYPLFLAIADVG